MQFKSEESVFNMAIAYLTRIDKLLYKSQEAAMGQNIDEWRNCLRAIYRELSVKLTDEEMKEIEGDVNKKITEKTLTDLDITEDDANFVNVNYLANNMEYKFKHKTIILLLLDKLDIKIRKRLQKKGMLLPSRDDPRYAVLKR